MQAVLSELNQSFADKGSLSWPCGSASRLGRCLSTRSARRPPRPDVDRRRGEHRRASADRRRAGTSSSGPGVYEATKEVIEYRELAPLDLKGKAEPVPAWEALRIRARQRGERPRWGSGTLVGRDEELAVL